MGNIVVVGVGATLTPPHKPGIRAWRSAATGTERIPTVKFRHRLRRPPDDRYLMLISTTAGRPWRVIVTPLVLVLALDPIDHGRQLIPRVAHGQMMMLLDGYRCSHNRGLGMREVDTWR